GAGGGGNTCFVLEVACQCSRPHGGIAISRACGWCSSYAHTFLLAQVPPTPGPSPPLATASGRRGQKPRRDDIVSVSRLTSPVACRACETTRSSSDPTPGPSFALPRSR